MSYLNHLNSQFCLLDLFEFCIYFQIDLVYHTFYNDVHILGRNCYRLCVAMSFHMQNTFYCCLFLSFIFLYHVCCDIYQFFLNNKDLLGISPLLALPIYLIIRFIWQLLLNFVNLSHLLKLFFGDGLNDNEKLFILYFTINIDKITSVWFLFHSGNKLIIWFVFSLFSLRKINYFKNWIYSWFPLIWKFSFYFIVINLNIA